MDNYHFDMTCEGEDALRRAIELSFDRNKFATHYAIRQAEPEIKDDAYSFKNARAKSIRIVFYWTASATTDLTPFPFKMDAAGCADFASRWLSQLTPEQLGKEPDHDGSNGRGWRVYNEKWRRVDGHYGAIIAVSPEWACYGK